MTTTRKIIAIVATPAGVYKGEFPGDATVADAIATIVEEMNLADGDAYELDFAGDPLLPLDASLESFGLGGLVDLDLVASGSAV